MNHALVILAATTLGSGIAAMHFHDKLNDEREKVATLATRVAELETRGAIPTDGADAATIAVPESTTATPPTPARKPAPTGSASVAFAPDKPAAVTARERQMRETFAINRRALLKDPDYREAMRLQHRMSLNQAYPDLAAELGLTSEEAGRFLDLLAEQQMRERAVVDYASFDPSDQAQQEGLQRRLQEQRETNEAEVAQLLGHDGLQRWQDYQNTMGGRVRARQLGNAFAAAGLPLTSDQQTQLRTALADRDRQRMPAAPMQLQPDKPKMEQFLEQRERHLDQTEQEFARSRAAVSHILSMQQMEIYQQMHESELAMQRAQLRIQRANLEATQRSGAIKSEAGATMALD